MWRAHKPGPKSRSGKGTSVHHNLPLSGDRAQGRESGSVSRKKVRDPPLNNSNDAGFSDSDKSSSSSMISSRERRVGNQIYTSKCAADRECDN